MRKIIALYVGVGWSPVRVGQPWAVDGVVIEIQPPDETELSAPSYTVEFNTGRKLYVNAAAVQAWEDQEEVQL